MFARFAFKTRISSKWGRRGNNLNFARESVMPSSCWCLIVAMGLSCLVFEAAVADTCPPPLQAHVPTLPLQKSVESKVFSF